MPSKKRRRDASRQAAAEADPAHHPLEGFHLLPFELQHLIISLACLVPASLSSCLTPFSTDSATVFNLCLVNNELRSQVQHLLYKEVSITRPSQLYALQQTLVANPGQGQLIERLHIGPQDILPSYWWPLTSKQPTKLESEGNPPVKFVRGPFVDLMTSLGTRDLPSGYQKRQRWALNDSVRGCRDAAVEEAIDAAQISLGINLLVGGPAPVNVGRIFELQAALDLYLARIRALERENPALLEVSRPGARIPARCRNGRCDHYPALVISETSASTSASQTQTPAGAYTVPRPQLLRHLARRGATTDRFDRPLYFERSGFQTLVIVTSSKKRQFHRPPVPRYEIRNHQWDIDDYHEPFAWPELASLQNEDAVEDLSPTDKALNAALVATATVGQILRLARGVLTFTPNLQGLSLTGFLECALDGSALPSLRRLSLGPPPVCWKTNANLEELPKQVEDLRLAGETLVDDEIELICQMSRLRKLAWTLVETYSRRMELSIAQTVRLLAVSAQAAKTSEGSQGQPKGSESEEGSQGESRPAIAATAHPTASSQSTNSSTALSIIITLHPSDLDKVLAAAPTAEVRTGWLEGLPNASGLRLLLLPHPFPASKATSRPCRDSSSRVWRQFYAEARTWWDGGPAAERPG